MNMKKNLLILFLVTAFAASVSAQQLEKLFDKYMEDERFTYIYKKGGSFDKSNESGKLKDMKMILDKPTNGGSFGKPNEPSNPQVMIPDINLEEKMLSLQTDSIDKSMNESFTREVDNALKADKYEQVSIVRNGKNRVEKYEKKTDKGIANVSFIKNPKNVMIKWILYATKE